MLAVVVVVNSLTLTHYQRTDLGYLYIADFRYWLIREALILARFWAAGMGVSSYVARLIRGYILYFLTYIIHSFCQWPRHASVYV